MADRFEDLGIAAELAAGAEAVGWDVPGGLQKAAVPVIRRGNNVVLQASPGSGVVGAYGLGLLDRLIEQGDSGPTVSSPHVLVLVPDSPTAARTADSLAQLAAAAGLTVRGHGDGWGDRPAHILVTTPAAAAAAVRDSALKLEGVLALVVDGLDQVDATGQWNALETVVDIAPSSAQRIVVTGGLGDRVDSFIERHVRKAMTVPSREPAAPAGGAAGDVTIRYRVTAEHGKAAAVAHMAATADAPEVAVICRSQERADTLEASLMARGIIDGEAAEGAAPQSPRVLVLPFYEADQRSTRAEAVSADVPFDSEALVALHARGGAVLVTPRERAHLIRMARRAGLTLAPIPDPAPIARNAAEAVRDRIRDLLGDPEAARDLTGPAGLAADFALIEPLLDEYPAAEVAAAALHLARRATQGSAGAPTMPGMDAAATATGTAPAARRPGAGAPPPATGTTWTHLFVSIGSRDDVGPGDIVGAMTGEAQIGGEQVGKIDIRESHTTVEVATGVAEQVIQALNGRTLKGRSLRVDYDRKERTPRPREADRGGSRPSGGGGRKRSGPPRGGPPRGGAPGPKGGGKPPRRG